VSPATGSAYEPAEFDGIATGGRLAAEILEHIAPHVSGPSNVPRFDTVTPERSTMRGRFRHHALSWLSACSCNQLNHVVCHGIRDRNC